MKPRHASLFAACVIASLLAAAAARAGEAEIRQAVRALAPELRVTSIGKSGAPGFMEVVVEGPRGPMVVYADDKGEYLLIGDLLQVKSRRNLTQERVDKLTEVKWDSLPLQQAVKVVRGNGQRKLAVFSDPDCPYCRKAEQEFMKLDNVTIYTFMYPLEIHPDAPRKSRLVWCSKDRGQAWLDLMLRGKLPAGKDDCKNPIDDNIALAARLRIDGTPAMLFPNGKRVPGYAEAARLEGLLNASQSVAK